MGNFSDRVAELRAVVGMSGRELSGIISKSPNYLGSTKAKRSVPSAESALAIAKVFGTTVEYLVAGEGEAPSPEQVRAAVEVARAKVSAPAA